MCPSPWCRIIRPYLWPGRPLTKEMHILSENAALINYKTHAFPSAAREYEGKTNFKITPVLLWLIYAQARWLPSATLCKVPALALMKFASKPKGVFSGEGWALARYAHQGRAFLRRMIWSKMDWKTVPLSRKWQKNDKNWQFEFLAEPKLTHNHFFHLFSGQDACFSLVFLAKYSALMWPPLWEQALDKGRNKKCLTDNYSAGWGRVWGAWRCISFQHLHRHREGRQLKINNHWGGFLSSDLALTSPA